MRLSLRFVLPFAVITGLAACGEAPLKAPLPGRNVQLDGGPTSALAFPTGKWADDYGNVWKATVADGRVSANGVCGPRLGLVLSGQISDSRLDYRIASAEGAVIGHGRADLINEGHAFFETRPVDGAPNTEGVLHFFHASPTRSAAGSGPALCAEGQDPADLTMPESKYGRPIDLRPDQSQPAENGQ